MESMKFQKIRVRSSKMWKWNKDVIGYRFWFPHYSWETRGNPILHIYGPFLNAQVFAFLINRAKAAGGGTEADAFVIRCPIFESETSFFHVFSLKICQVTLNLMQELLCFCQAPNRQIPRCLLISVTQLLNCTCQGHAPFRDAFGAKSAERNIRSARLFLVKGVFPFLAAVSTQ